MGYDKNQIKTEDLDIIRNFVIQKANGIEKSMLDTVFYAHYDLIHSESIKCQFKKYFNEFKGNTGIIKKSENKILAKHLSEMSAIISVETWGDSVKKLLDKIQSDPNIKAFKHEAKSLNKGHNLIGNDISSKDIQNLRVEVGNEMLASLNKKHAKSKKDNNELKGILLQER